MSGFIGNKGGDLHKYLGHFRSSTNVKRGHNQGAPGMTMERGGGVRTPAPATQTPKPAVAKPTYSAETNPIAAAKQAGLKGAGLKEAKAERAARNKAGFGKSDIKALRAADVAPVKAAQEAAKTAHAGVVSARKTLQATPRHDGVVDRSGLQAAKAAQKTARQTVRRTRGQEEVRGKTGTALGKVKSFRKGGASDKEILSRAKGFAGKATDFASSAAKKMFDPFGVL